MRKRGFIRVWKRNFFVYSKSGVIANLWIFFEPLFYLLAFGIGIGSFIQSVDGKSYLDFFFPGLLITTAALVTFQEASSGYFLRSRKMKLYETWILLPIKKSDIFWGEFLWSVTRGMASAFGVTVAGLFLGLYQGLGLLAVFAVAVLVSFMFGFIGIGFALRAKQSDSFLMPLTGFFLPLIFISGILFPLSILPLPIKLLSHLFPFVHAVEISRNLISHKLIVLDIFHILYLIIATVLIGRFVHRSMMKSFTS